VFEMEMQINGSDNDEAEPSSMVDSALSGGSCPSPTKTSVPLFCGDHFTSQFAKAYCLGCPRPDCSHSLNGEELRCTTELQQQHELNQISAGRKSTSSAEPLAEEAFKETLESETFEQF